MKPILDFEPRGGRRATDGLLYGVGLLIRTMSIFVLAGSADVGGRPETFITKPQNKLQANHPRRWYARPANRPWCNPRCRRALLRGRSANSVSTHTILALANREKAMPYVGGGGGKAILHYGHVRVLHILLCVNFSMPPWRSRTAKLLCSEQLRISGSCITPVIFPARKAVF